MLDCRHNVVRRFGRPDVVQKELTYEIHHPGEYLETGYTNVILDSETGLYRMWYPVGGSRPLPGGNFTDTLCYAESRDGFHWTMPDLGFAEKAGVNASIRNVVGFDKPPCSNGKVYRDPFDPAPDRRYKMVGMFWADEGDGKYGVFVSPNGTEFTHVPGSGWYPDDPTRMGSDTDNNILFNPVTGRYQVICRWACLDRRIAITQSDDLIHWESPLVCVGPDPLDEPLLQFYSMAQFHYRDHFIGLMQLQHIASTEMGACKWLGKVDNELTYSYNGVHWKRTDRRAFIPRTGPGTLGAEQVYTNTMLDEPDGTIRFYSTVNCTGHGTPEHGHEPEGLDRKPAVIVHRLREEGFAYIEPIAGYGFLATRHLLPRDADLRINFLAPNGYVWVQAAVGESPEVSRPHEGFSFDDCIPLKGDETDAPVRWKNGRTLDELGDKYVRLEFKLFQTRLYAVHWDFQIRYGDPILERI